MKRNREEDLPFEGLSINNNEMGDEAEPSAKYTRFDENIMLEEAPIDKIITRSYSEPNLHAITARATGMLRVIPAAPLLEGKLTLESLGISCKHFPSKSCVAGLSLNLSDVFEYYTSNNSFFGRSETIMELNYDKHGQNQFKLIYRYSSFNFPMIVNNILTVRNTQTEYILVEFSGNDVPESVIKNPDYKNFIEVAPWINRE